MDFVFLSANGRAVSGGVSHSIPLRVITPLARCAAPCRLSERKSLRVCLSFIKSSWYGQHCSTGCRRVCRSKGSEWLHVVHNLRKTVGLPKSASGDKPFFQWDDLLVCKTCRNARCCMKSSRTAVCVVYGCKSSQAYGGKQRFSNSISE